MNKRSAVLVAAGLVAVLALGGAAFSLGLTGPATSVAAVRTKPAHIKPIVRTHVKKVVVHKKAPAPAPVITYVSAPAPSYSSAPAGYSGYGDDGYEGEGGGGGGGGDD